MADSLASTPGGEKVSGTRVEARRRAEAELKDDFVLLGRVYNEIEPFHKYEQKKGSRTTNKPARRVRWDLEQAWEACQ